MGATLDSAGDSAGRDRRLAAIHAYGLACDGSDPAQQDLVVLAARACDAPIALVTVIGAEYQTFTARVGTDLRGTHIDRALCIHALNEPDLLVIPDLSADPRTVANPMVTGDPGVCFYAGVPLRVADGTVVGTLCVLDVESRPAGLTDVQRDTLMRLARQVGATMELRRSLRERDAGLARAADAEAMLSGEERRWQRVFENIGDGFAVGEVIRDAAGRVVDWRYLDANPAWFALSAFDRATMLAGTGRGLDDHAPAHWADDLHQLIATGDPVGFVHHAPRLRRRFRGRCFRIEGERFGVILHDTTEEFAAAMRQAALVYLGDALRDCRSVADVTRVASALVGETLGVDRAGFGRVDGAVDHVEIEPDWTADGVVSIAGRHRFADYGDLRDGLARGEPLVIDDPRTDPRTAADPAAMLGKGIGALINMPVRRDGRTAAIFLVHSTTPRRWTADEVTFLRKVADRVEVGVAQVEAEARQDLLVHELAHRLKNTLSVVQAIASQTLRGSVDRAPLDAFEQRLQALGVAHDVLVQRNWMAADMRTTAQQVIAVFGRDDRIVLSGPDVALGASAALGLALILHELGTNAVKYGALSNATGSVTLDWRVDDDQVLTMEWHERGGPPVVEPPRRRGFGSRLLRLGLAGAGDSELVYATDGLHAVMRASIAQLAGG